MARAIPIGWARFNRKMSFHFPSVFPLISDRLVWHNGKHPKCLIFGFREEQSKASLIGAFMLARGVSRRRKAQIANFWLKNPTAHVLLQRVSQSLGSIRGSGDENGLLAGPVMRADERRLQKKKNSFFKSSECMFNQSKVRIINLTPAKTDST